MKWGCQLSSLRFSIVALLFATLSLQSNASNASDALVDAVKNGKFDLGLRYRFEHVDDDRLRANGSPLRDAKASTLRTTLGYRSGEFYGFSARLLFENVTEIGADDYNDGSNGKTQYATVVDPTETEIDEAYIRYTGLPNTSLTAGRQYLTYRKAPFHRFMGTILWRQNWQTQDALKLENTSLPNTTLRYAYIWNVNRIFGEDARGALANFDSDSHTFNIQYTGLPLGKLEAYAYLLDFDNAAAFSSKTFGVRYNGRYPFSDSIAAIFAAEYAHQSDHANNPNDIDADYFLGEIGAQFALSAFVNKLTLKFNYELLGGDGGADRFVTILGTNHAYQGWADRFLITPGDGIEDFYVTLIATFWKAKLIAVYHDLNSDNQSYDYGEEIDILLSATFRERYTVGLKYSHYDADRNSSNLSRNGANSGVTRDLEKFWAFAQVSF